MRTPISLLLLLLPFFCLANMASPYTEGGLGARPFVSANVRVLHEDLTIQPDANFERALITATYFIEAEKSGAQIPLLFYASAYLDGFTVAVDGANIPIQEIPEQYRYVEGGKFSDFASLFAPTPGPANEHVEIKEDEDFGITIRLDDLLYFEVDLTEGKHAITVSYTAQAWAEAGEWINTYDFRYALSPAKYWKSFGTLSVTLDARGVGYPVSTNLPVEHPLTDSLATWQFNSLPVEVINVSYTPPMNNAARVLVAVSPLGLAILFSLILILLHYRLMYWFRKQKPTAEYSAIMIIGSILVPFLFLVGWMFAYDFIDEVIGIHAAHYHGYLFFIVFLYPIALPVYWTMAWLVDVKIKSRILAATQTTYSSPPG